MLTVVGERVCVCVSQDAGSECVVAFVPLQHSDMGPRKDLPGL